MKAILATFALHARLYGAQFAALWKGVAAQRLKVLGFLGITYTL
jgi:hypothetical protein